MRRVKTQIRSFGGKVIAAIGYKKLFQLLLRTGKVDPNWKNKHGQTLLFRATRKGNDIIVELLLGTAGVKPGLPDDRGETPRSRALRRRHYTVVGLLDSALNRRRL
jgi:ankyrin repeat protein